MTISEYTERLALALEGCSPDEIENAVQYYTELIEDSDDPAGQMQRLGEPEALAERIKRESGWLQPAEPVFDDGGIGGYQTPPSSMGHSVAQRSAASSGKSEFHGALVVLTFPLWFTAFVVLAAMIPVVWSVYACFPATACALVFDGILGLRSYMPLALLELSASLTMAGLSVLLVRPAVALTKLLAKAMKSLGQLLFAPHTLRMPKIRPKKKPRTTFAKMLTIASSAAALAGIFLCTCIMVFAKPSNGEYIKRLGLTNYEQEIDASQNIKMDIDMGNLTIVKSKKGESKLVARNIIPDHLTVSDTSDTVINYTGIHTNRLVNLYPFINENASFELYLPEERIAEIFVESDLGDITVEDLEIGKLELSCSAGSITLRNIRSDSVNIDSALGDIETDDLTADKLEIDNANGSVTVKDTVVGGEVSGEISLGDAEFENVTFGRIDFDLDCGDVYFNGELTDSGSKITESLGDISIELKGDGYNVYATCSLGEVDVDDKLKGTGSKTVTVENECGDITVSAK